MRKAILEQRFEKCWKEFCEFYEEKGPRGTDKAKIKELIPSFEHSWARIFENKNFWTESDIVRVLTNICAKEFKKDGSVHNETPIDRMFSGDCEKSERYYVDIDIIDPDNYKNGIELRQKHPHDIFAEVKWISKGMWTWDIKKNIKKKIPKDCLKLKKQIDKGRCKVGYVCIVNDEPNAVERLCREDLQDMAKKWEKEYWPVKVLIC